MWLSAYIGALLKEDKISNNNFIKVARTLVLNVHRLFATRKESPSNNCIKVS